MLPLIGITSNYFDQSNYIPGSQITALPDQGVYSIPEDYITSIEQAGGIPIIIPVIKDLELLPSYVDMCDGILLTGAVYDVAPERYGEKNLEGKVNKPVPRGDNFEICMAQYVIRETKKPLLGICRGHQVINVAMGGTLYQDLEQEGFCAHCFTESGKENPQHEVFIEKNSWLYRIFGEEVVPVNSLHHQAVKDLGSRLVASAVSKDGVIESYEINDGRFVLGIQWHPEMMLHNKLQQKVFSQFIQMCSETRENG